MLECTGNEQYVLPLMISLFTARVVGSLFNSDLYHIHIHLKKGVQFLDHELRSIGGQHNLYAGHIMSREVVFVRPIERVSVVYDILTSASHSQFPVIDTEDRDVLYGTINSTALCMLLQARAYGAAKASGAETSVVQTHVQIDPFDEKYVPLVPYKILEREYTSPKIEDIRIDGADRELYMDLRPYCNTAPHTIQETTTVNVSYEIMIQKLANAYTYMNLKNLFLFVNILQRAYELFRALGLRILIVTNRYNQCVGVISRDDITNEALAQDMITKGKVSKRIYLIYLPTHLYVIFFLGINILTGKTSHDFLNNSIFRD